MKKHKKQPVSDIEKGDSLQGQDGGPIGEALYSDLALPSPLNARPVRVRTIRDAKKLISLALLRLQQPGADLDACKGIIWGAGEFSRIVESHEFEERLAAVEKQRAEGDSEYE